MLWETLSAARDLGRLHTVAVVLVRYGFGDVVQRVGMAGALERAGKLLHWQGLQSSLQLSPPERARQALEELGPCFVKLGQILATRVDLFEPEWIGEFEKLQNAVPPVAYAAIEQQLREDLGAEPASVFAWLDPAPLAAASIAQVHRARLHDGSEVVVKIRRPDIKPLVEADLRLLERLARIVEAESDELRRFRPTGLVRQLQASLTRELDLAAECRHAERIAASFSDDPRIVVPAVYWPWTGERMNVQTFVDGVPLADRAALAAVGCDAPLIARIGAQAVLRMMFTDGFFHADPHPGNVFWLPGNRLALIDFGMVGRLSERRRLQLVALLSALVGRDAGAVTDVLLEWTDTAEIEVDEAAMAEAVDAFIDRYHGVPLKQLRLGLMLGDIAALLRQQHLALPSDLALVMKVFVTLEGMGRRLDPDFDMASEAAPFVGQIMRARLAPAALARRGWHALSDGINVLAGLPHDLRQMLRRARQGQFHLNIEVPRLKQFGAQMDHSVNRLTIGIVIAALIIGSSIVMTVSGGPTLLGLPVFGLLGFVGAVLGSLWLLFSIWRSGGGR